MTLLLMMSCLNDSGDMQWTATIQWQMRNQESDEESDDNEDDGEVENGKDADFVSNLFGPKGDTL